MQQLVDVESRQDNFFDVYEFVQECLWGYVVNFAQVPFGVHDYLVLDWEFLEHVTLECFEELFELLAVSADQA